MFISRFKATFQRRGISTTSSVCSYSVSGKRTSIDKDLADGNELKGKKVPKFTMARQEFMMADLFSQHRQVVAIPEEAPSQSSTRPSFKTMSELSLLRGMSMEEAQIPHTKLRQIYSAPSSVYMRVAPDAMIPEGKRLGPLAEPLLGQDPFKDGLGGMNLGKGTEMKEFVEEFFDTMLEEARQAVPQHLWSVRRAKPRANGARSYQMTSVRRKRKTKMNKHKHRKLRKRTRALRKRLGK